MNESDPTRNIFPPEWVPGGAKLTGRIDEIKERLYYERKHEAEKNKRKRELAAQDKLNKL